GQRHAVPAGELHQAAQERRGGVVRVHDLVRGAPATGAGALLEQAQRVVVVVGTQVAQVVQVGLLQRRGHGDLVGTRGQVHLLGGVHDRLGVGQLVMIRRGGALDGGDRHRVQVRVRRRGRRGCGRRGRRGGRGVGGGGGGGG